MSEFDALIKQIKQAAVEAVEASKPAGIFCGKVISASPLKISIDQKLTLQKEQLILTGTVTDHEVRVKVDWDVEKGEKKIMLHKGLKAGEKVVLARMQGGQKYIVLDRMV